MILVAPIRIASSGNGRTRPTVNAGTINGERQHVEQVVPNLEQVSGSLSQCWLHKDQESVWCQPILDQGSNPAAPFLDALFVAWVKLVESISHDDEIERVIILELQRS